MKNNIKRYINFKSVYGVETVDQLNLSDFDSPKAFRTELKRLVSEYRLSGTDVYISQRPDKTWDKCQN